MTRPTSSGLVSTFVVATAIFFSGNVAQAAEPSTSDCLFARDASSTLQAKRQLRAAREQLQVCAATSCPAGIQKECAQRADEVRSAMPTVLFVAEDSSGHDVSAVKVSMDGQPLLAQLTGTSVGIDPGEHQFTFEVAGKPPASKTLALAEGDKEHRVKLEIVTPPEPLHSYGHTQRVLSFAFGGASLVGLALGTGFGLSARSNLSKSRAECASSTSCEDHDAAISAMNAATTQATISTGAFIAGGAFLATGLLLYFTAPRSPSSNMALTLSPAVGSGTGGFLLRGTF